VQFFLVLSLVIAIALVLFALQNAMVVTVSFLSFHFVGSLAFILVIVFAAGFLAGILVSVPSVLRKGAAFRQQKKKVKQLEEDLEAARKQMPGPETKSTSGTGAD
jgi:putative membrane protein